MNDPSTERVAAGSGTITVAAIGDLHVTENGVRRYRDLFAEISDAADVLVLAGDLTDFGKPGEAELLAEDLRAARSRRLACSAITISKPAVPRR
jgi:Icc-related predicted phosphoesterase